MAQLIIMLMLSQFACNGLSARIKRSRLHLKAKSGSEVDESVSREGSTVSTEAYTSTEANTANATDSTVQGNCDRRTCGQFFRFPEACSSAPYSCGGCSECLQDKSGESAKCMRQFCNDLPRQCKDLSYVCEGCPECGKNATIYNFYDEKLDSMTADSTLAVGGWMHIPHGQRAMPVVEVKPQVFETNITGPCRDHMFKKVGTLGQGANGQVFQVERFPVTNTRTQYALKEALSSAGQEDILWEAEVMTNTRCAGVMEVTDTKPCLHPASVPLPASYVSAMMRGSLWDWAGGKDPVHGGSKAAAGMVPSSKLKATCGRSVFNELYAALQCFHRGNSGFIHGDFKGDNIYYSNVDELGCPIGIKLADFGLSMKIGTLNNKYEGVWHTRSGHLPSTFFQSAPDRPKVGYGRSRFYAQPVLDLCAFTYFMLSDWGLDVSHAVRGPTRPTDCGMMGSRRATQIWLQG